MRYITVLGSTGSIGVQTLEVMEKMENARPDGLSTYSKIELLEQQARQFKPDKVCVVREDKAAELKIKLADTDIKVLSGPEGLVELASSEKSDTVVTGIVGIAGLIPTLAAIKKGKRIALANKETLVTAGNIVMSEAKKYGSEIIPVDSEHSAVFQCLAARVNKDEYEKEVDAIVLTASGGPFFGRDRNSLENVTRAQALAHPNWEMGAKITIDSATLMNKGLEVLEAAHLFNMPLDKIEVLVHRQSIIHSMVRFCDNATIAQLGVPDMKLPIQYAITYPKRMVMTNNELDFLTCGPLTFDKPDTDTFRCLTLAYRAGNKGGTMPVVLNGANEEAVALFLQDKIRFLEIADVVESAMNNHEVIANPTIDDILSADKWAREYVLKSVHKI
ncbi:MAG: 1-deoxy-D-xylulose-5-phosphate reductoisomerase [Clostridia bacterium]|nr:1-deoxy-D-xylulose-5-phosphate reductoisomerase [Clostridia bacterium]